MKYTIFFLLIFWFNIIATAQKINFTDYFTEMQNLSDVNNIEELNVLIKEILMKYDTILPQHSMLVGYLKNELNNTQILNDDLINAQKNGVNVIEYYPEYSHIDGLNDLKNCDTCEFNLRNSKNLYLINQLLKIDQLIRENQIYFFQEFNELDEELIKIAIKNDLLRFSNSGYAQIDIFLIFLHASSYFKKNEKELTNYLFELLIEGEINPYLYSTIIDRWYYDIYDKQYYGTIGNIEDNTYIIITPIFEIEKLSQRRRNIGLPTLENQLEIDGVKEIIWK